MANIIVPKTFKAKLEERSFLKSIYPHMVSAVLQSFVDYKGDIKRDEVQRRVDMCIETAKVLRFDFKWSFDRIKDMMPFILKNLVKGIPVDLDKLNKSGTWLSSD